MNIQQLRDRLDLQENRGRKAMSPFIWFCVVLVVLVGVNICFEAFDLWVRK